MNSIITIHQNERSELEPEILWHTSLFIDEHLVASFESKHEPFLRICKYQDGKKDWYVVSYDPYMAIWGERLIIDGESKEVED